MTKPQEYSVTIEETLDWKLAQGQTLREAIVDDAEEAIEDFQDRHLEVTIDGNCFKVTIAKD
jgi:hypothetical protein